MLCGHVTASSKAQKSDIKSKSESSMKPTPDDKSSKTSKSKNSNKSGQKSDSSPAANIPVSSSLYSSCIGMTAGSSFV